MSRNAMTKEGLVKAIQASGGKAHVLAEVDALWPKIELLQKVGRYTMMLKGLESTNNMSNFFALVFEINFAYQFEMEGVGLQYEVPTIRHAQDSVDFLLKVEGSRKIYIELRRIQQEESIGKKLREEGYYLVKFATDQDRRNIQLIQKKIIEKIVGTSGPIKFRADSELCFNIIAVDASERWLRKMTLSDCKLVMYGDQSVERAYPKGIVGLFQKEYEQSSDIPLQFGVIQAHLLQNLHGVLFLFKEPNSGLLSYRLEKYLMRNPELMSEKQARPLYVAISRAIPDRASS